MTIRGPASIESDSVTNSGARPGSTRGSIAGRA